MTFKGNAMADKIGDIDAAARVSRRQLLGALATVLVLGLAGLTMLAGTLPPGDAGPSLWIVLPVLIAVLAAALKREAGRIDARALDAVRRDELRQASLHKAWRDGFLAMLALQPPLALALAGSGHAAGAAVAIMAAASVTVGAVGMLASLLWHDR